MLINRRLYADGGSEDESGGSILTEEPKSNDGDGKTIEVPTFEDGDWRSGLSDEHKVSGSIKDLATPDDVVKKLIHAESMIGADKIVVPGKDASKEEIDTYHKALGRPDKATEYELPTENMPEGIELDPEAIRVAHEAFHTLGISKQQGAELIRLQAQLVDGQNKAILKADKDAQEEATKELRTDENFGGESFDQNMQLAQGAVVKLGGDELKKTLDETGLGNLPALVKAFAKAGRMMADDSILGGGPRMSFTPSEAEAKAQINALYTDQDWVSDYHSEQRPGHDAAVAKMRDLSRIAYPEKK